MSRMVKLAVMGVAGAALLYSCAPGIGSGLGALPYLWFFSNPFFRGQATAPQTPGTTATTTRPGSTVTPGTALPSQNQGHAQPTTRGGFGGSASQHGTTGSS